MKRREFLKIAGISTILGLGGMSVVNELRKGSLEAAQYAPDPKTMAAKRWAMVIDMKKFKTADDYQKCVDVCHSVHNVPDIPDPKREIKWLWPEMFVHAFPAQEDLYLSEHYKHMPFLVTCNHCANPPCVRVCPTKATFKRMSDGIVMMDMHRCIGCRFCMAACPYGARSFNWQDPRPFIKRELNPEFPTRMKGVVEKCTFCYERLAKGLMPACVEASNGALIFGDVTEPNSEIRKVLNSNFTIRRRPELGTGPSVYYIIGGNEHA
ncbi:MAG: 4Fe-4S ferredoxin [Thermodesulfovibrio sp.]|nr:4Fe-4S ferredoxin [Thermodesulfovibrio sp.]